MKKLLYVLIFVIVISSPFQAVAQPVNLATQQTLIEEQIMGLLMQLIEQLREQILQAPFSNPKYSQTSSFPVSLNEKIVTYEYDHEPCGTLMTQYAERGSVYVGRGPVYGMALNECQKTNTSLIPDDSSFRTYSCKNTSYLSGNQTGPIFAKATFAFQCIQP